MANIKAINVDDEVVYLKAVGDGTVDNPHVSVSRVESTVLPPGAATEAGQQKIPGFDIPKHNRVVITEDAAAKLSQVIYYLDNLQVCALSFEYSGYAFVEPYKTTTITRS